MYFQRFIVLFGYLMLTFAIFLSNFSTYTIKRELSYRYNKNENIINLSNELNLVMTGLFSLFISLRKK